MKVVLKIGRLNAVPERWWFVCCDGKPVSHVLPVERFRTPASVIEELKNGAQRWNYASVMHPARWYQLDPGPIPRSARRLTPRVVY